MYSLLLLLALISHEYFWTKVHFDKHIDSVVFSRAHGCILNDIEGVPFKYIKFKFMHKPWGASLFRLKHF
jgi:hypothetical protein